ncbi:extracellular solute-binding protein [Paenibacillus sp. LHD-117]|uniref:extracellular solute-binding protein n=1 Tax=Paenibacillus sp. LHD-117 TaxID=3071412 RepID=UPI0027E1D166|nr:extracellular solute-binding protein [Paenibacillus sp. LHD-117]MDQ6419778.1 extracellular solute-binding protein [Paenibacillus sp. LHD-117]
MKRAALRCLALAVLLTTLSGCLGNSIIDDPNTVKRIGEEPQKRIVIWHTYSDEETLLFEKEIIPAFEAEHPDIVIESVRQTHNREYHAALLARASAGKTPDIIRMDYTWIPVFAQRGLLHPIESMPGFDTVSEQLRGRMLDTNRHEGHVYGLPLNITTKAAIYNTRLLDKMGMQEPPSSFAELARLARENGYTLGMTGIDLWNSLPYFFANGGQLADEAFTRTEGYFNSDRSVAAAEELLRLFRDGIINPSLLAGNADLWREVYASQKLLMMDEGPWYYSILLNSAGVDVNLLQRTRPVPFPSGGDYRSIIGGENLVMTKGTRNKPEAWIFMSWMTRKETQLKLLEAGLIPVNTDAFEEGGKAKGTVSLYLAPYMESIHDAFYRPSIPQWNEIERIYNSAMEDIFIRGENIKETLDDAARKMDVLLEAAERS